MFVKGGYLNIKVYIVLDDINNLPLSQDTLIVKLISARMLPFTTAGHTFLPPGFVNGASGFYKLDAKGITILKPAITGFPTANEMGISGERELFIEIKAPIHY